MGRAPWEGGPKRPAPLASWPLEPTKLAELPVGFATSRLRRSLQGGKTGQERDRTLLPPSPALRGPPAVGRIGLAAAKMVTNRPRRLPGGSVVPSAHQSLLDALTDVGGLPLPAHGGAVTCVAFSPDDKLADIGELTLQRALRALHPDPEEGLGWAGRLLETIKPRAAGARRRRRQSGPGRPQLADRRLCRGVRTEGRGPREARRAAAGPPLQRPVARIRIQTAGCSTLAETGHPAGRDFRITDAEIGWRRHQTLVR